MKNGLKTSIVCATFMLLSLSATAKSSDTVLRGPYLGQKPPGLIPEPFAPGVISTKMWEINGVFTPDMQSFYYIREIESEGQLHQQYVRYQNIGTHWQASVVSPRVGQPAFSPDGNIMHLGRRFKSRQADGWSEIKTLSEDFTQYRIMRMTSSSKGSYVFDEASPESNSQLRISTVVNGERQSPVPLSKEINTGEWNAHPYIAPDESYIIWDGQRNSEVRNADLFISFKEENGSWSEAIKFGEDINTPLSDFGAMLSPDGKYLFFNRKVGEFEWTSADGKTETIPDIDIYWVDAQVIENLRP